MELRQIKHDNPLLYRAMKARRRADKALQAAQPSAQEMASTQSLIKPSSARFAGAKKSKREVAVVPPPSKHWFKFLQADSPLKDTCLM